MSEVGKNTYAEDGGDEHHDHFQQLHCVVSKMFGCHSFSRISSNDVTVEQAYFRGVMARAAGQNLHGDCLSCATCGSSLRNVGHHFIDGEFLESLAFMASA